jgi:hypothetical protein
MQLKVIKKSQSHHSSILNLSAVVLSTKLTLFKSQAAALTHQYLVFAVVNVIVVQADVCSNISHKTL